MSTESDRDDYKTLDHFISTAFRIKGNKTLSGYAIEADDVRDAFESLANIKSRQHELEARLAEAEKARTDARMEALDLAGGMVTDMQIKLDEAERQIREWQELSIKRGNELAEAEQRAERAEAALEDDGKWAGGIALLARYEKTLREIEAHELLPFGPEVELMDPWSTHNLGGTIESMKAIARSVLPDAAKWTPRGEPDHTKHYGPSPHAGSEFSDHDGLPLHSHGVDGTPILADTEEASEK